MDSLAEDLVMEKPSVSTLPPDIEQRIRSWHLNVLLKLTPYTIKYSWFDLPPNPRHDDPHLNAEAYTLVGGAKLVHKIRTSNIPFDTVKLNPNVTVTITYRCGDRAERLPNRRTVL